ncbi:hypothetical protein I4F81_003962 [Pyropia yezoensis]|uniref:Uncharacterized protein n=1 Tax=Pyropia yezoensis TaxID=2788 RepID=A0ACC3BUY6_PYRYE|nr:hypothetical protein I4F81_003962 [Neopyropia yezoensis]
MSLPRGGGGGCGPAGSAAVAAPYAGVRARVARWAAQPSLLRWTVACARAQVRQAVDTAADLPSDGTVVGRLQAFTPSLLAWATLAPRQLLDAAPGVVAHPVDVMVELASSQPVMHNLALMLSLMTTVEKLANVDPRRLRSVPCLPRAVVAASSYLTAQPRPYDAPHEAVASSVLALLGLYATADVHQMADRAHPAGPALGGRAADVGAPRRQLAVILLPDAEYQHRPDRIAGDLMDAAAASHGFRALLVVFRQHPPLLRTYGPRALGLGLQRALRSSLGQLTPPPYPFNPRPRPRPHRYSGSLMAAAPC